MKPWLPLLLLLFVSHILEKIKSVLHLNPYYIHTVHCIELLGLRVCVAYIPNAGSEEEREEIGDDEGVDDLLRVRRPLLVAETRLPDGVEGPAGVVGAQLARRRRFSTSDNVGEFPLPAECKFRR